MKLNLLLLIVLFGSLCGCQPVTQPLLETQATIQIPTLHPTETWAATQTSLPTMTFTSSPRPTAIPSATQTAIPQPVSLTAGNVIDLTLVRGDPIFHHGVLQSAKWTPNGQYIVVTTNMGIDILDDETLTLIRAVKDWTPLGFMEDGRMVVQDSTMLLHFLSLETGEFSPLGVEIPLMENGYPLPHAISPDGKLLAIAESPNIIRITTLASGDSREFNFYLTKNVPFLSSQLKFGPDNNQLFLQIYMPSFQRSGLLVFDISKSQLIQQYYSMYTLPEFSPDNKRIVLAPDKYVRLLSASSFTEWSSHTYYFQSNITAEESAWYSGRAYSFLVDSTRIGILYNAEVTNRTTKQIYFIGTLIIYNTSSGKVEKFINGLPPTAFDFKFNPDGTRFFTLAMDGFVSLWDEDGNLLKQSTPYEPSQNFKFSPDGNKLAFPIPGGVRIQSAQDGEIVKELSLYPNGYPNSFSTSFVGNNTIAIGFRSYNFSQTDTFDLQTGEMIRRYPELSYCDFNRAGNTMICDLGDLELFDVETGRTLLQFSHNDLGRFFTISDDGVYSASCTPDSETIFLWDTRKGIQIKYLRDENNRKVCGKMDFSDDSGVLVSSTGTIWSIPAGEVLVKLPSDPAGEVAISPEADFVVIYPGIFDLKTGKEISQLPPSEFWITDLFFIQEGKELLIATNDSIQHWAVLR